MKKVKSMLGILLALCLTLAYGCSPAPASSEASQAPPPAASSGEKSPESAPAEPVRFTFASWAFSEEALLPSYSGAVNAYVESRDQMSVEFVTYPYAQYLEQLIVSAAANNAPEFAHIKDEWIPQLAEMGALLPLEGYLSDELKQDYVPSVLESETIGGEIMGAPWFSSPYIFYYNKTLLAQAGCEVPSNWSEFVDAVYKISALGTDADGNKYYGLGIPNSESQVGAGYQIFPYLWVYGGDFTDGSGNVVLNTPENIEAFTQIRKFYQDNVSPNGLLTKELRNLFGQGYLGFCLDMEAGLKSVYAASPKGEDFASEVGALYFPAMDGPEGSGFNICHSLVAFNGCQNTAIIGEFFEHMTSKGVEILYEGGQGKLPCRTSCMDTGVFADIDNPITKTFLDSLNTARPIPLHVSLMDADARINESLAELAITDTPVEDIVSNLDKDVKEIYGQ